MSLVSVIINCLNGEKYLKETIESVFSQTYQNFEIIFWDNNSTDNTAKIAQSFDSKLKYFKGEKTVPLYNARNLAIEKASGEFVAIIDSDDLWLPHKLETQLKLFKNPKVGVVYSDSFYLINNQIKGSRFQTVTPYRGNVFSELFSDYFVPLTCIMLRTEALKTLPYVFDSRFQMIGDQDLMKRLAFTWEFDFVLEPLAKIRLHEDNLSKKFPRKFAEEGEIVLETYKNIFPDFENKYSNELNLQLDEIDYIHAKCDYMENKLSSCRKICLKKILKKKFFMLFVLSFIPKKIEDVLLSTYKKVSILLR